MPRPGISDLLRVKNQIFLLLICIGIVLGPWSLAQAQLGSTDSLLRRTGRSSTEDTGFDSSRYGVRPSSSTKELPPPAVAPPKVVEPPRQPISAKVVSQEERQPLAQKQAPPLRAEPVAAEDQSVLEKDYLKPDDRDLSLNLLELSLAPTFIYNDSQSEYWYRRYLTSGPGFRAGVKFWISPSLGINANFLTSMVTSVNASMNGSKSVPVDHQEFSVDLNFRKFIGIGKKRSTLIFGLGYREYQLTVPKDETLRIGMRTSGVRISLNTYLSRGPIYAWNFGVDYVPRATHEEHSTGVSAKSGSEAETEVIGLWIGGRWAFDRRDQVYWRIRHSLEQSRFQEQATVADPKSGSQPEGVRVQNGLSLFELGYTWGD